MKLLNFDTRTLILENVKPVEVTKPTNYTSCQVKILRNVIQQKHVTKQFFELLLHELYSISDWHELTYSQMYQLIYILNHWNYKKRGANNEAIN